MIYHGNFDFKQCGSQLIDETAYGVVSRQPWVGSWNRKIGKKDKLEPEWDLWGWMGTCVVGLLPPRGLQLWCCECPPQVKPLLFIVMLDTYWTRSQRSEGGYSRSWTCYEPSCCLFPIPDQVNQQNKQPYMWDRTAPFALLQNSEYNKNMAISFFCLPNFP